MLYDKLKLNKNIARRFIFFGIGIVAVTWITAISDIRQKVEIELDGVKTNNQNLALVLEEHVSVVLSQIESQLLSVRRNYEYGINNNEMQLILETTVSSRPDLFNLISIIDSDGNVRLTNQRHFTSTYSGDRDFFIYHKNNIDPSIKIGKPLLGRVTGKWYIPVSLLLRNKNGDFDGVLLVSLNPDYFSMIFRKLKLGEKSVIYISDYYGVIYSGIYGGKSFDLNLSIPPENLPRGENQGNPFSDINKSFIDGHKKIRSFYFLDESSIFVSIQTDLDEILEKSKPRIYQQIFLLILLSAVFIYIILNLVKAVNSMENLNNDLKLKKEEAEAANKAKSESLAQTEKATALLSAALEQNPAGIMIADAPNTQMKLVNNKAIQILGMSREDQLKISLEQLNIVDFKTYYPNGELWELDKNPIIRVVTLGEEFYNQEMIIERSDGTRCWISLNGAPVKNKDGAIIAGVIVFSDISDIKESEKELKRSYEKLDNLNFIINHSPAYAFLWRAEENWPVEYVSENIFSFLGYTIDDFYSGEILFGNIIHPDDLQRVNDEVAKNLSEGLIEYNQEYRIVGKDGEIHWVDDRTWIRRDESGNILFFQGILMDITSKKQAEDVQAKLTEQLRHSQKMDAIGQLAGGVAHDFNNMLSAILTSSELLHKSKTIDEKSLGYVETIRKAALRSADLTKKLLSFARKGKKLSTSVNMIDVIQDTISILKGSIDKSIEIDLKNNAESTYVIGDYAQLQNVFINLGINASHAMVNGGVLSITMTNVYLDADYCNSTGFQLVEGDYIEIAVRDTGCGIPLNIQNKIFEPFFTTKETGSGTGLGLAVVYSAVQDHHGAITVYSEEGKGTVFNLYFAVSEVITTGKDNVQEIVHGSGRILIVDDEDLIRVSLKAMLEDLGYDVLEAQNGKEAVMIYQENMKQIDLVILDMIMPVMKGVETFKKLKEINPDCKILISSGFSKDEDLDNMKKDGLAGFIQKPYRKHQISSLISEIISKV